MLKSIDSSKVITNQILETMDENLMKESSNLNNLQRLFQATRRSLIYKQRLTIFTVKNLQVFG